MAIISSYTRVPASSALIAQENVLAWVECIDRTAANCVDSNWATLQVRAMTKQTMTKQTMTDTKTAGQKKAGQLSLTIGPLKKLVAGTGFEPVTFGL